VTIAGSGGAMSDSDLEATFAAVDVPSRAVTVGSSPFSVTEELQTGG
jgi:hypothetical protein